MGKHIWALMHWREARKPVVDERNNLNLVPFTHFSALQGGHVESSVEMIKVIEGHSLEEKRANLRVMILNVSICFEPLSNILKICADVVLGWIEEERANLAKDTKFHLLLAMTMRAKQSKDWFKPEDKCK